MTNAKTNKKSSLLMQSSLLKLRATALALRALLKRLWNMERQYGVQGLIRNNYILILRVESNATRVFQQEVWSADRQAGRRIAVIEDAPHSDEIIQAIPAADVF